MTVVVAYLCSDGVVLAADSMLTPSVGSINVGHHHGVKVHVLPGPQLFSFAGDNGQAARFRHIAEFNHSLAGSASHPLDYAVFLSQTIIGQLANTGIQIGAIGANAVLAFQNNNACHCCVFEGPMQPRLLDQQHYYTALGSGKLSADPFLRFLDDIFCLGAQPNVREAIFLSAWTVQHVIETNPGGVAGPIRIAVFETDNSGGYQARALPDTEIYEHEQAIGSAADALRAWRASIEDGDPDDGTPPPPEPPIES